MMSSNVPVTQNAGQQNSPGVATGLEKQKNIQYQLLLILHTQACLRRENQSNGEAIICPVSTLCQVMKRVFSHMPTCHAGKSCDVQHCYASKQIISHWENCYSDCPVCVPIKELIARKQLRKAAAAQVPKTDDKLQAS